MTTIVGALLPLILTLGLGYFAGWHNDFKPEQASVLNQMVLLYALPLLLFTGIVTVGRNELTADFGLAAAIVTAMVATYVATFLIVHHGLHQTAGVSALTGLVVSSPSVAFSGYVVLGYLYGPKISAVPVVVGALVLNVVTIPVTLLILSVDAASAPPAGAPPSHQQEYAGGAGRPAAELVGAVRTRNAIRHPAGGATVTTAGDLEQRVAGAAPASLTQPHGMDIKGHFVSTVKQPVVWVPILALVLVLSGVDLPSVLTQATDLLGSATAGVAFFATGIVLFAQRVALSRFVIRAVLARNIVVPAVLLAILTAIGMAHRDLRLAVLTLAMPAPVLAVTFAVQYEQGQREMASMVLFSSILSFITLAAFIELT